MRKDQSCHALDSSLANVIIVVNRLKEGSKKTSLRLRASTDGALLDYGCLRCLMVLSSTKDIRVGDEMR